MPNEERGVYGGKATAPLLSAWAASETQNCLLWDDHDQPFFLLFSRLYTPTQGLIRLLYMRLL